MLPLVVAQNTPGSAAAGMREVGCPAGAAFVGRRLTPAFASPAENATAEKAAKARILGNSGRFFD